MLEFVEQHKSADLSAVKAKLDRAKHIGKVLICGVLVSSTMLLSGCCNLKSDQPIVTKTVVIIENGNALIVDAQNVSSNGEGHDSTFVDITTSSGDVIYVSIQNVHVISGENSRELAENYAESFINENGKITYYENIVEYGKSK